MAKYSFEFKKEIVVAYLSGKGGFGSLAKDYGIPNKSQIYRWVKAYQKLGDDGLRRSQNKNNYSSEYKISVVKLYLSSELSYQELALKEGINSPALIGKWVNAFQIAGPDALRPRMKGRKKTLDNIKKGVTDTSVEHVKELEDELLKLKIENAFLKELRRLRLEDEAKMRERRKSSTVSEDSSN
ncbi:MAG: helix-turn-helix domain-containing protein [Clostridium sp.]|jgi:transposase|nr:helix-turn-helix domain-containing protein [Clostridium sp.]